MRGTRGDIGMCRWLPLLLLLAPCCSAVRVGAVDREDAFVGYSEDAKPVSRSYLSLDTELGSVDILLLPGAAPKTVEWLRALLKESNDQQKFFYRAESVDKGYALVQGQFSGLSSNTSLEAVDVPNVRGSVALIPGTSQFIISLLDHHDFDGSFTIFGNVVDTPDNRGLSILSSFAEMPVKEQVDISYGTVMQMLVENIPFNATISSVL